jgi:hypothetical protein
VKYHHLRCCLTNLLKKDLVFRDVRHDGSRLIVHSHFTTKICDFTYHGSSCPLLCDECALRGVLVALDGGSFMALTTSAVARKQEQFEMGSLTGAVHL